MNRFIPQSEENRAAIRTALSALFAVLIAYALHLDKPYWSGMTVVILANIYSGSIVDKALMRLIGTFVGAWLGYFLAGLVANSFFLYLVCCFFLILSAVYYYNLSRYAYAYLMAALSAFIVISEVAIDTNEAFLIAIWRPVEIGLGVLISSLSAFCIFPNAIQHSVVKEVDSLFYSANNLFELIQQALISDNKTLIEKLHSDNIKFKKKIRKAQDMITFMRREIGYKRKKIEQIDFLLGEFYRLSRTVGFFIGPDNLMSKTIQGYPDGEIKAYFARISQQLMQLRTVALEENSSIDESFQLDFLPEKVSALAYQQWRLTYFLRQLTFHIETIHTILVGKKQQSKVVVMINDKQQLRYDPDVIMHGVKAGLAAILALIFWLVSNWPGGINGIISSIIISVRKDLAEMENISTYRFIGCLLGGSVAVLTMGFAPMTLYTYIVVIFIFVWLFSYFSFTKRDYSYIGLQANIALIITLTQSYGPAHDLTLPLERLAGVAIGISASFIVFNLVWRTDLLSILQRHLKKIKKSLKHNCLEMLNTHETKILYDLTSSFWRCRVTLEALTVLKLSRFKTIKLKKLQAEHRALLNLHLALYALQETIDEKAACSIGSRLGIDLVEIKRHIAALFNTTDYTNLSELKIKLNRILNEVIERGNECQLPISDLENCAAYVHALKIICACRKRVG